MHQFCQELCHPIDVKNCEFWFPLNNLNFNHPFCFKLYGTLPKYSAKYKLSLERKFSVVLLFYVHGKHLRSCRDGQLT